MIALSDRAEEIGLGPAMAEGTAVRTPFGWQRVEALRPGDLVTTMDGGAVPVRDISRREVPWAGSFAPAALSGREGPVLVTPDARVLRRSDRGAEVMVRASDLGEASRPATERFLRYVSLTLDRAHLVSVGGCWMETRAPTPGPVLRPRADVAPIAGAA